MNRDEIRVTVLHSLQDVAPEADLSTLGGATDVREALDIDSMDFLRFVVALNQKLRVDVPERDYGKIRTLDGCVEYLAAQQDTRPPRTG